MIHKIKHLCYVLRIREQELDTVIKNLNSFYYEATSVKQKYGRPQQNKDGTYKLRTLHPSTGRLKSIQAAIHSNILLKLPAPSYAFGSIKGRNNIENAKQHLGNKYFFCADLKDFFPSINNHMVFRTFLSYGFSPTISRILTQLTTFKGALPQGAPTSPLVANLVFVSTGSKILKLTEAYKITFTTFLDDFSFSAKSDFKFLTQQILEIIKFDGYSLSHKKITYKVKYPEITGINISKEKMIPHFRVLSKQQETHCPQLDRYIKQILLAKPL
jgi:RNA-directed DNA polymerase